jgi:hypothetical protein
MLGLVGKLLGKIRPKPQQDAVKGRPEVGGDAQQTAFAPSATTHSGYTVPRHGQVLDLAVTRRPACKDILKNHINLLTTSTRHPDVAVFLDAPRTMTEAAEKLFSIKDGRLENLSPSQRTALAERIHFVATGTKKEPSYLVVDKGEGQTPNSFKDTFLSLTKQNKDDIPFVQGRFNCGGTGVLPFCGDHKYELIMSRRDPSAPAAASDGTKDLWGFTLVRRQKPAVGRKSSMYVYLAPGGSILTFSRPSVNVLPGSSSKNKPLHDALH